ncbi:MAG: CPBP family intramembrane metalloprotease [Ruminococcaceae bacterium]|nr:CPBP family intramembrane metalloprotease [Oscillospiraceae bacterium]
MAVPSPRTSAKRRYILCSVLLFSLAVTCIDAFVHPPYFSKIPIKIVFFLALPMLYFIFWREERNACRELFRFRKSGLFISCLIGCGIYAVIVGGYLLTRNIFDFSGVTGSLGEGMGITADNFLYVAVYISVMNSFLEEFFFRGFGFLTLKKFVPTAAAYLISPLLFAVYHVGMIVDMFQPAVLALILFGLVSGGVIFNALNHRFGNLYPSWLAHMAANFAINTVGFLLFDMI